MKLTLWQFPRKSLTMISTQLDLRLWMLAKGLDVAAAAIHFKVSPRTVYRWLDGTTKVPKWLNFAAKGKK